MLLVFIEVTKPNNRAAVNEIAESFGEKVAPLIKKMIVNQQDNQHPAQLCDWLLLMLMNGQVVVE